MNRMIVVGSCNMDIVIQVPHIPVVGETILSTGVSYACGGKGANQATAIAKLGAPTSMIGCVGSDEHGREILSYLRGNGVDISALETNDGTPTGNAYINVSEKGENNIVVNPGANNAVTPALVDRHANLFDGADFCVMQLEIPLETIYHTAQLCREKGVKLVLNPAPAAALDFSRLGDTYMILPNESELALLIGGDGSLEDKAKALAATGCGKVLVTLGGDGCMYTDGAEIHRHPAYTGLKVVDTTAAGDSFVGALLYALANGEEFEQAVHTATVAAAITVSRPGAQPSLPTMDEVQALLNQ